MLKPTRSLNLFARMACSAILGSGLLGVTVATAQTAQDRQHQERDAQQRKENEYHYIIKPQQDKNNADAAAILARPSNWGPGEIRDAVNYGALAWYQKGPNQYGYVFNQGSIRNISAQMNVEMECEKRKLACNYMTVMVNKWVVIGTQSNQTHFAVGDGPNRAAAETAMHEECRKQNTTCTIKDVFEVMPHRRGVGHQRLKTVVR